MLIDTHTHLYLKEFDPDREEMLKRATQNGVEQFYLPNIDSTTTEALLRLEAAHPQHCIAMMGLHPCSVRENFREELAIVKDWLWKRPFCAIGEIGLDLHWDTTFAEEQKTAFCTQIKWAKELDLPIVIHSRKATDEILEILKEEKEESLSGIFHCFGGTAEQADEIISLGFYLGIGGVLTFKNAGLDATMKSIPLDHVVLETDSPYLAPAPHRGKRNESAYLRLIAEKLASLKGLDVKEIEAITSANARKIFEKSASPASTIFSSKSI